MSSPRDFVLPPRLAVWLVSLFAPIGEVESMVGDLLEEFSPLAERASLPAARRWYWRQTLKTIPALLLAGFRSAPSMITAAVIGGFLLRWFVSWCAHPVINRVIEAVLEKSQVYEHGSHVYISWLTNTFLFERFLVNLLIGVVVAFAAKGREMTATVMLSLVSAALAVQSVWMGMARTGDQGLLGTLPWSFAFYLALVVGGAMVRILRLRMTTRPMAT